MRHRLIDTVYDWVKLIGIIIGLALIALAVGYSAYIEMDTKIAVRDAIKRGEMPAGVIVNTSKH